MDTENRHIEQAGETADESQNNKKIERNDDDGVSSNVFGKIKRFRVMLMFALACAFGGMSCSKNAGELFKGVLKTSAADFKFCDSGKPDPLDDYGECIATLNIPPQLKELAAGLFDPHHPQSVVGEKISDEELEIYKKYRDERKQNGKRAWGPIEYFKRKFNKNPGKIVLFRLDPEMTKKHFAVSRFLYNAIDRACEKTGLGAEECLIYHVITFENSGQLWAESSAGAVGPSQIMPNWYKYEKNLSDGIKTENFFRVPGKFDGRYDPITNVEMGARILKYYIEVLGKNHYDFVVHAYNQGEPALKKFVNAWALKHQKKSFKEFFKKWRKQNRGKTFYYKYFLDAVNAPLAEMLKDEKLVNKFMGSDNGGSGYLSKILAMNVCSREAETCGMSEETDYGFSLNGGEPCGDYVWGDLFKAYTLPPRMSLKEFAEKHKHSLNALILINRHILDPNAKFDQPVRIWFMDADDESLSITLKIANRGTGLSGLFN